MNAVPAILTFLGGLAAGFCAAYLKHHFDKDKARFDFRTKILREVWEAVFLTKSLAANLTPEMDFNVDPSESQQQRRDRLLPVFYKAHLEAKRILRFNKPFYPVALHDMADKVLLESFMQARFFQQTTPQEGAAGYLRDYWERSEKNISAINELSDKLCDAIRRDVNGGFFS